MTIKEALTIAILTEKRMYTGVPKHPVKTDRVTGRLIPTGEFKERVRDSNTTHNVIRNWMPHAVGSTKFKLPKDTREGTPGRTLMRMSGAKNVESGLNPTSGSVPTIRGGDVRAPAKVDLVRTADGQAELRKIPSPQEKAAKSIQQARKDLNISQGHPDGHIRLTTRNQN